MKKFICMIIALAVTVSMFSVFLSYAEGETEEGQNVFSDDVDATSAILIEAETGTVLFEKNADEQLPPASVTKVMTLLLVMEAIDEGKFALTDQISVSSYAASMGGSQVYLKEGESMSVEDLLKCTVISSANDAAVALAEAVSGSESAFIEAMNQRADELGLSCNFENVTGLDDDTVNHTMSARDIAVISAELISHEKILDYSSIWMDTIRDGAFTLTNTNRLVRFYNGCNGLKTGSTSKAKFCVSATAKRDGMQLICVIMGAPTRDVRNETAKTLLDWGFAQYGLYTAEETELEYADVLGGVKDKTALYSSEFSKVLPKGDVKKVELLYEIPESIAAPVKNGDVVGCVKYMLNGEEIGKSDIFVREDIEKISYVEIFLRMIKEMLGIRSEE